ncbi:MAG: GNAT family N-acetyltransferase [Burkholderiaceae bacterium]|nr:GNAT family N-acetyltransferase [Burkholderiaceae bacterium]
MRSVSRARTAQPKRSRSPDKRSKPEAVPTTGASRIDIRALTPSRWPDLEAIFRARGCSVARGCWCMFYRVSGAHILPPGVTLAQARRSELKALVDRGRPPGLIGYRGRTPVGWVSIGPREDYARLRRSPVMKAVDAVPVWSIVCFVVPAEHRGQGLARQLLAGAIDYAARRGATVVEAYPVDKPGHCADETMWFGAKSMFDAAGFREVARRKATRPIMRLRIGRRTRQRASAAKTAERTSS